MKIDFSHPNSNSISIQDLYPSLNLSGFEYEFRSDYPNPFTPLPAG